MFRFRSGGPQHPTPCPAWGGDSPHAVVGRVASGTVCPMGRGVRTDPVVATPGLSQHCPILVCHGSGELFGTVRGRSTARIVPEARPIAPWPRKNGWKTGQNLDKRGPIA